MCKEKFINPFTDFGFKRLFGSAKSKEFLISFLNSLFCEPDKIADISYRNVEQQGYSPDERAAVFDLYCTTDSGAQIIVEMQRGKQRYFKDRTVYYSSFPMSEATQKGEWNYQLPKIYTVAFLDFCMPEYIDSPQFKHVVKLTDLETGEVFFDKLAYFYLEMPKFNVDIDSIDENDYFNIWLYIIKNLHHLEEAPKKMKHAIFLRFLRMAEIMAFTQEERDAYEASLKSLRDYKNSLETSKEDGIEEGKAIGIEEGKAIGIEEGKAIGIEEGKAIGIEEGKAIGKAIGIEQGKAIGTEQGRKDEARCIARSMKDAGVDIKIVSTATNLTEEEINSL